MHHESDLHSQRTVVLWIAAAMMGAAVSPATAQIGLGLAPMRTEIRMAPGARQSGVLTLSNESPAPARIRAELLDFVIDQDETPQFKSAWAQEAEYSCRGWLSLNPMETEVRPNSSLRIRYTIDVPAGAPPRSYHCAAGFRTLAAAGPVATQGLNTAVRVIAAFYVIVGNPAVEAEIRQIGLEPVPNVKSPQWRAYVVIQNYGFMHIRPVGELEVTDASGKVVERRSFDPIPILPRRTQRLVFPVDQVVANNRYRLHARVDLGTPELQDVTGEAVAGGPYK